MSLINFSNTTPAAPAGLNNLSFQSDASGNLSAYDPGGVWQSWTPTLTASGAMTVSVVAIGDAQYVRMGPLVFFKLTGNFSLGGTLDKSVLITLPVPLVGNPSLVNALFNSTPAGAFFTPAGARTDPTAGLVLDAEGTANYPAAGGYSFYASGFYRVL